MLQRPTIGRGLGFDFDFGGAVVDAASGGDFSFGGNGGGGFDPGQFISDFNPADLISQIEPSDLINEATKGVDKYNAGFVPASQQPPVQPAGTPPPVFAPPAPPIQPRLAPPPPPQAPPPAPIVPSAAELKRQAYFRAVHQAKVAEYLTTVQTQKQAAAAPTLLVARKKEMNWTPYIIAAALVGAAVVLR